MPNFEAPQQMSSPERHQRPTRAEIIAIAEKHQGSLEELKKWAEGGEDEMRKKEYPNWDDMDFAILLGRLEPPTVDSVFERQTLLKKEWPMGYGSSLNQFANWADGETDEGREDYYPTWTDEDFSKLLEKLEPGRY